MKNIFYILIILLLISSCKRPTNKPEKVLTTTEKYTRDRNKKEEKEIKTTNTSNIVKMTPRGGIYEIPIEINGVGMNIIFDTGASSISISETEVLFLIKHGELEEDDVLGEINFQDATGGISQGTLINLKQVKIGNKILENIEASVVHNLDAPLLLGQSALSKFGKVTIDYQRNEIIFN